MDDQRLPHQGRGRMAILLASDGSRSALTAADFLAARFSPERAQVSIVVVRERYTARFESCYPVYDAGPPEDDADEMADKTAAHLLPFGPETIVREGDPVRVILDEVRQRAPDLLVVGHRGLRGIEGAMLGSVAKSLVQYSPVPVLVIPATEPTHRKIGLQSVSPFGQS